MLNLVLEIVFYLLSRHIHEHNFESSNENKICLDKRDVKYKIIKIRYLSNDLCSSIISILSYFCGVTILVITCRSQILQLNVNKEI